MKKGIVFFISAVFIACVLSFFDTAAVKGSEYIEPISRPEVIIESFRVQDGSLMSGKSVTLYFEASNKSPEVSVHDLTISYRTSPSTFYSVFSQSNRQYVGSVPAGGSTGFEMEFMIASNVHGVVELNFTMEYKALGSGENYSVNSSVYLPVISANSFSFQMDIQGTAWTNIPTVIGGTLNNFSAGTMYELTMNITGGFESGVSIVELGDMEQGRQTDVSLPVVYREAGITDSITIEFSFFDEFGNMLRTGPQIYNVRIMNLSEMEDPDNPPEPREFAKIGAILFFLAAGALSIGMSVYFIRQRSNRG